VSNNGTIFAIHLREGGRAFQVLGNPPWGWMGHPPTGRRFRDVDEIYIFRVSGGKLAGASGVEDNLARMRQLGLKT
jgi:predicted ester cyclase